MTVETKDLGPEIAERSELLQRLRRELEKVIVGQGYLLDRLILALIADGHVLIEGVPGLAKTTAIRTLGEAIHTEFTRVQFTPDLLPADLIGTEIYRPQLHDFVVKKGPVFTNLLLADEINRAPAKVQSALLEAMQERQVTIGGETHQLPDPFLVLATQNPIEQEGTYPLPEAQLDRFFFKLLVGYSSREELAEILNRTTTGEQADIEAVLDGPKILAYQELVRRVIIAPHVQDYAVRLVLATHPGGDLAPLAHMTATMLGEGEAF